MKGETQIYTGDGKGKTTAAIGAGIRAAGAGMKVLMIRFMRPPGESSEEEALKKIASFEVENFGVEGLIEEGQKDELWKSQKNKALEGLERVKEALKEDYDLLILDEALTCIRFDLIEEKDILKIIQRKPDDLELIMTGLEATDKLVEKSSLVTEMRKVKHYYDEGIEAREGIEY